MSKVSIIIPAFNQARFLTQAIESALGQTHPSLEVIVVDDGSTDETPQLVSSFATEERFRCVRQANIGLPGARNRGFRESVGEYVCFLDSDDFYHPDKVARQVALLDADPDVAFVYCDIVTTDEGGTPLTEQASVNSAQRLMSGNIFHTLMLAGYFPPHTVMIRRTVVEALGGFDPQLGGHADYDLWLRASAAGHRACYLDERLAYYRTHIGSMSRDADHMLATRKATFLKLCRQEPSLVAQSLINLQEHNRDLFLANSWLHRTWHTALREGGTWDLAMPDGSSQFTLLKHLERARLVRGVPEQMGVWDVTVDGSTSKALYLAPPAQLVLELPTAAGGEFRTAVTLHPEVWNQPTCGGCEFRVRVGDRAALALAIDPANVPSDRRWHEVRLHVSPSPSGNHRLILETSTIGNSADFRWALWRMPKFSWTPEAAGGPTPAATPLS